jgi:hypothetical protein
MATLSPNSGHEYLFFLYGFNNGISSSLVASYPKGNINQLSKFSTQRV